MSEYLRLTHNLLVSLGGTSSPEVFPLNAADDPGKKPPTSIKFITGKKKFEPTSFVFFQGALVRAYIVGHIYQEDGPTLPVLYAIVTSGVLMRDNGVLQPYFPPILREVVLVPENLGDGEDVVDAHIESGLDIERYPVTESYRGIRQNATNRVFDILADVKKNVFNHFVEAIGDEDHLVLIDGSLRPDDENMTKGNWVGIFNNPRLTPEEEDASLELGENEIGSPFSLGANGTGYFWHLRMYSDARKDPSWGIVKLENSLEKSDDMESKISAISSGILAERFPIHPRSEEEDWRLYPLITAKVFLDTQTTDESSILKYF